MIGFLLSKFRRILSTLKNEYKLYCFSKRHKCHLGDNINFTGNLQNLSIGENTTINSFANFRFGDGKIEIGKNCLFARNVTIITQTYDVDAELDISSKNVHVKDVFIGDNVWIGGNVVILPGVRISNNSVVGAGSIVTKNIGESEIWAGSPARFIRKRNILNG